MAGGHTGWLVGGGVLIAGAVAALPFYRGDAAADTSITATDDVVVEPETTWNRDPLTLRLPGSAPPSRTTLQPLRTQIGSVSSPLAEPPQLDGEYGGLLQEFGEPGPAQELSSDPNTRSLSIRVANRPDAPTDERPEERRRASAPADRLTPTLPLSPLVPAAHDSDDDALAKSHTIVDGDTLERIALRYYGDATYATALYEHNRQVLSDPELLPVGEKMLIPPRAAIQVLSELPVVPLK